MPPYKPLKSSSGNDSPFYGSTSSIAPLDQSPIENTPPNDMNSTTEAPPLPYYGEDPPYYCDIQKLILKHGATTDNPAHPATPAVLVQPSLLFPSDTKVYIGPRLTAEPEPITCRVCKECVVTKVEAKVSMRTHVCALLCFVMGGCCCLGWVPYFVDKCKTKYHYCPKCDDYVGIGVEPNFIR